MGNCENSRVAALRSSKLFSTLDDAELASLNRLFVERKKPRDALICQEGDAADAFYFLLEGKVKVMLTDAEGREVIVALLGEGEGFGEMALLDADARSAQIMTLLPSRILVLPGSEFRNRVGSNPRLALAMMRQLSERLRQANRTISALATLDVKSRVAKMLLDSARPHDSTLLIPDPLSQSDIAGMVGASRERVNRALKALEAEGFLRFAGGALLLHPAGPERSGLSSSAPLYRV